LVSPPPPSADWAYTAPPPHFRGTGPMWACEMARKTAATAGVRTGVSKPKVFPWKRGVLVQTVMIGWVFWFKR
jgi:hypothetical protein